MKDPGGTIPDFDLDLEDGVVWKSAKVEKRRTRVRRVKKKHL